jgi:hypothetical protein
MRRQDYHFCTADPLLECDFRRAPFPAIRMTNRGLLWFLREILATAGVRL